jgi:hypothetical protein
MKLSWSKQRAKHKILSSLFIALLFLTETLFADEHNHLVNYTNYLRVLALK